MISPSGAIIGQHQVRAPQTTNNFPNHDMTDPISNKKLDLMHEKPESGAKERTVFEGTLVKGTPTAKASMATNNYDSNNKKKGSVPSTPSKGLKNSNKKHRKSCVDNNLQSSPLLNPNIRMSKDDSGTL